LTEVEVNSVQDVIQLLSQVTSSTSVQKPLCEDVVGWIFRSDVRGAVLMVIHRWLFQGSANRKVAATNMNRESSRSHSVFTCIIESRWERDSMTNIRFGRLNLVDLAGSER
jgi:kinesin family protein 15